MGHLVFHNTPICFIDDISLMITKKDMRDGRQRLKDMGQQENLDQTENPAIIPESMRLGFGPTKFDRSNVTIEI
jgi:hypothetical protein